MSRDLPRPHHYISRIKCLCHKKETCYPAIMSHTPRTRALLPTCGNGADQRHDDERKRIVPRSYDEYDAMRFRLHKHTVHHVHQAFAHVLWRHPLPKLLDSITHLHLALVTLCHKDFHSALRGKKVHQHNFNKSISLPRTNLPTLSKSVFNASPILSRHSCIILWSARSCSVRKALSKVLRLLKPSRTLRTT